MISNLNILSCITLTLSFTSHLIKIFSNVYNAKHNQWYQHNGCRKKNKERNKQIDNKQRRQQKRPDRW